jgi:hypothetical protein
MQLYSFLHYAVKVADEVRVALEIGSGKLQCHFESNSDQPRRESEKLKSSKSVQVFGKRQQNENLIKAKSTRKYFSGPKHCRL